MHDHAVSAPGFGASVAMWFGMMTAMMAPTVWPWIRSFARFGGSTASFASGYLASWLAYSIAAAAAQIAFHPSASFASAVFVAAGVYQLAPLKRACLAHCRNPISFFLARWRNGPAGGFRMGVEHGLYCVGCCWALMATTLAVGMANVGWMAALGAVAFVEQVVRRGDVLRVPLGLALIAAGLRVAPALRL